MKANLLNIRSAVVLVVSLTLLFGVSMKAGPPPLFVPHADGYLYNVIGDSIYFFVGDTLRIGPGTIYWDKDTVLTRATFDSMVNGYGRFNDSVMYADTAGYAIGIGGGLEVFGDFTIYGNLVEVDKQTDWDFSNAWAVNADTFLEIPTADWLGDSISFTIRVDPTPAATYEYRDTIIIVDPYGVTDTGVVTWTSPGSPTKEMVVDSMVKYINLDANTWPYVHAYDSVLAADTFYIIKSDVRYTAFTLIFDANQDTTLTHPLYTDSTLWAADSSCAMHSVERYFPDGSFYGYSYAMVTTTVPNSGVPNHADSNYFERPDFIVSYDGITYTELIIGNDTLHNPILKREDFPPGAGANDTLQYFSDNTSNVGANGLFWVYVRVTYSPGDFHKILAGYLDTTGGPHFVWTSDGGDTLWTGIETITDTAEWVMSPTVVTDTNNSYTGFTIEVNPGPCTNFWLRWTSPYPCSLFTFEDTIDILAPSEFENYIGESIDTVPSFWHGQVEKLAADNWLMTVGLTNAVQCSGPKIQGYEQWAYTSTDRGASFHDSIFILGPDTTGSSLGWDGGYPYVLSTRRYDVGHSREVMGLVCFRDTSYRWHTGRATIHLEKELLSADSLLGIGIQAKTGNLQNDYIMKVDITGADTIYQWEVDAGGAGLTYWTESDVGDTSFWTAAGGNTILGMNDKLSMRGFDIVDAGTVDGLIIGTDVLAQQTIGIADDNLLEVDHVSPADDDYAKFTVNGLEGRSYAEVATDLESSLEAVIELDELSSTTAWRIFYSAAAGDVTEFALGADGTYLKSTGLGTEPTWATPSGTGEWVSQNGDSNLAWYAATDTGMEIRVDEETTFVEPGENTVLVLGDPGRTTIDSLTVNGVSSFSGAITTTSTIDTVDVGDLAAKVHKDTGHFIIAFSDPNSVYDTDSLLCIKPVTQVAITITRIDVTCDADPATEPAMKLSHTDNFIDRTTPTTIDVITTTNGTTLIVSGFDDPTIPASRCIYFAFTADPISAIKSITVDISYTID